MQPKHHPARHYLCSQVCVGGGGGVCVCGGGDAAGCWRITQCETVQAHCLLSHICAHVFSALRRWERENDNPHLQDLEHDRTRGA